MTCCKSTAFSEIKTIRATDAKEVGVENPAEETYCHPNPLNHRMRHGFVNLLLDKLADPCAAEKHPFFTRIAADNTIANRPATFYQCAGPGRSDQCWHGRIQSQI